MLENLVWDVEADGFLTPATKCHMLVTQNYNTDELLAFHDYPNLVPHHGSFREGVEKLQRAALVAGHNIKGYDIPLLGKLENYKPQENQTSIDTITLSRLMYPERYQHDLKSWAKTLKLPDQKVENDQWEVATQRMLDRCLSDVRINTALLKHLQIKVKFHAEEGTNWLPALFLEQDIQAIHAEQTQQGVVYDKEEAIKTLAIFDPKLKSLRDIITRDAPSRCIDGHKLSGPAKARWAEDEKGHPGVAQIFRKAKNKAERESGMKFHTATVVNWFSEVQPLDLPDGEKPILDTVQGDFCKISYRDFNPDSDPEIKEYLFTLGWMPDEYNIKKLPDGTYKQKSPKLSQSSFGSLPPGLGQTIKDYRTLKHRRGLIQSPNDPSKGAIGKMRPDGRVQAEAITCGTPTARYTHSGAVCNIPRPSSPWGEEVRKLYGVASLSWMVGVDLAGIEARILAHGCCQFPGGEEFARLILTKQDGGWHQANANLWQTDRDTAKTFLYALCFGAGPQKLGNILGKSKAVGAANKKRFMVAYKPYALLEEALQAEMQRNGGWIQGIDGRRFYCRAKKDALNTYTQGNAAIVFKEWMRRLRKARVEFPVPVHQIIA